MSAGVMGLGLMVIVMGVVVRVWPEGCLTCRVRVVFWSRLVGFILRVPFSFSRVMVIFGLFWLLFWPLFWLFWVRVQVLLLHLAFQPGAAAPTRLQPCLHRSPMLSSKTSSPPQGSPIFSLFTSGGGGR